jgi:hypothetical protein
MVVGIERNGATETELIYITENDILWVVDKKENEQIL